MKRVLIVFFLLGISHSLLASNEIGPEGYKLAWLLGSVAAGIVVVLFFTGIKKGLKSSSFRFPGRKKVTVELKKDRLYYPRFLDLTLTNSGKADVDIANPMLVLSSIWVTRRFKLKGTNKNWFYPLYLPKDQNHTLRIDLHRFYGFDRTLKRLPRARVVVKDVNGRHLGSRKVLLRKTLFNI
ncbi:MAG: hypothetical protein ACOC0R_06245 [Mariniphaga sp.]